MLYIYNYIKRSLAPAPSVWRPARFVRFTRFARMARFARACADAFGLVLRAPLSRLRHVFAPFRRLFGAFSAPFRRLFCPFSLPFCGSYSACLRCAFGAVRCAFGALTTCLWRACGAPAARLGTVFRSAFNVFRRAFVAVRRAFVTPSARVRHIRSLFVVFLAH